MKDPQMEITGDFVADHEEHGRVIVAWSSLDGSFRVDEVIDMNGNDLLDGPESAHIDVWARDQAEMRL